MPITFGSISGAEPSTVTFAVETAVINSLHREILVIGDPISSLAVARVTAAAPASTEYGQLVRIVGGPSSAVDLSMRGVWSSTLADNRAIVYQSTAADLNVTVAGYSTIVSVANQVKTVWSSTLADNRTNVYQSTATDLLATVNLRDGSGNALASDVAMPSTATRGLVVRHVLPGLQSFAASTAFNNSSAITLVSSGVSARGFVYAYSITSTLAGPISIGIYDGATLKWTVRLAAISSAISGANLAVTPPAYLCASSTGSALTINVASTNAGMDVAVAYFVST